MEEQQNNNLSVEILNGNTESLTGLVGNAHALKEPGIDYSPCQYYTSVCVVVKYKPCCLHPHRNELLLQLNVQPESKLCFPLSFSDIVGAQSV